MKKSLKFLFGTILLFVAAGAKSQKIDSLFFNLYTDSLKKGTYNYINVDAKLSNGQWMPLTEKQLSFSCSSGKFSGNSLFIDTSFKDEKVTVKVSLKSDPSVTRQIIIYIKKYNIEERLKTVDEILNTPRKKNRDIKKSGR